MPNPFPIITPLSNNDALALAESFCPVAKARVCPPHDASRCGACNDAVPVLMAVDVASREQTIAADRPENHGSERRPAYCCDPICLVPGCPGPENARKLADYARLTKLLESSEEAVRGTADVRERLQEFDRVLRQFDVVVPALERIADEGPAQRYGANTPAHCVRWVLNVRADAAAALKGAGLR